jgi:hypothetical protein
MAEKQSYYSGFTVVLGSDVNEDGMKKVLDTILMIKGIIDVKPIEREPNEQRIQKSRIKEEIMNAINETVKKI